jgi:hypothetical protein
VLLAAGPAAVVAAARSQQENSDQNDREQLFHVQSCIFSNETRDLKQ